MRKSTRRLVGGLAMVAGAIGAAGVYLKNRNKRDNARQSSGNAWARPGMMVTFRAELMPGREREERTFRVNELLPSGRVSLVGVNGEHAEREFERVH